MPSSKYIGPVGIPIPAPDSPGALPVGPPDQDRSERLSSISGGLDLRVFPLERQMARHRVHLRRAQFRVRKFRGGPKSRSVGEIVRVRREYISTPYLCDA
jgi:hypothetical protein